MKNQEPECCPKFDVEKWDKKEINWDNKLFIKETMSTLFHIPFPPTIGKKVTKLHGLAVSTGATIPDIADALILFRDPTAFKSEIFYAVTKAVNGANNVTISGSFVARVFDGSYNAVPKFIKEMDKYLKENKKQAKDYYIHYAYCPKCAKATGHNYMILFALV
jgi:hypothetical protein